MIAGVIAAAVVVAVAFGTTMYLVLKEDDGVGPSAVASESPASPSATATSKIKASSSPTPTQTGLGDVRDQPAGLFCRDLFAKGFSYVAAVDYWRNGGQPNQMDADRNGIPCQTVYPPSDVSSYWGNEPVPQPIVQSAQNLPDGLFCRDLNARGYDYSQAVDYWIYNGLPDRMDADLNGIPCETVYPQAAVNDYWY